MRLILLPVVLLSSSCVPVPMKHQAWREIPVTSAGQAGAPVDQRLLIGDIVRVQTKEGKAHIFRVYRIEDVAFYGTASNKKNYRVGYGALAAMEVRRSETDWVAVPIPVAFGGSGAFSVSPDFTVGAGSTGAFILWPLLIAGMFRLSVTRAAQPGVPLVGGSAAS